MTDLWKRASGLLAEWRSLEPHWRKVMAIEAAAIVALLMLLAAGA